MSWIIRVAAYTLSARTFYRCTSRELTQKRCERGREGEDNQMKLATKRLSSLATAIFAVGFAAALAPVSKAGDPPSSSAAAQPASASPAPADTQQRLQDLEKEVELLQQEIASLKESSTPGMKTASYAQPAGAPENAAAAPEDTPKVTLASLLGSTTFSGFVDTYYGFNSNHPFNNTSGLRFFDGKTNAFGFNMAELIVDRPPGASSSESRFGYHVSAGYGQAASVVNGSDIASDGSNFFVKEAYGSYLAPIGKGLRIDVGKFVTSMGNEVIETNANWNYSRSILFYYAIPYFHFGARATYTFNNHWQVIGLLVNGWNNSFISHTGGIGQSSGLTYHGEVAWTPTPKWSVTAMYMAGPVIDAYNFNTQGNRYTISDWKQLSDTIISYTPNSKWAFAIDGDYGFGPRSYSCEGSCVASPAVKWWGPAGYAKYNFSPKSNFAVRYEYYEDPNGYTGLLVDPTDGDSLGGGHAQEVTGTYSYNLTSSLLVRTEYRHDFASQPIFLKGSGSTVKEQNTATLGFVYSFSSPTK
jgi:Putative beta-barrel porin-2, OmpL-like. bbp2